MLLNESVVWKQAQCIAGNKIRIFDAPVEPLYGFQTPEFPAAQMSRLESFHFKSLFQSEEPAWQLAHRTTQIMLRCTEPEMFENQRIALAGHILYQEHSRPFEECEFSLNSPIPLEVMFRRVGWFLAQFYWEYHNPNNDFHLLPHSPGGVVRQCGAALEEIKNTAGGINARAQVAQHQGTRMGKQRCLCNGEDPGQCRPQEALPLPSVQTRHKVPTTQGATSLTKGMLPIDVAQMRGMNLRDSCRKMTWATGRADCPI